MTDTTEAPARRTKRRYAHGWRTVHRIDSKESECPDCTEEVPA